MSDLRAAAQQALEALTASTDLLGTMYLKMDAITALRAALEQESCDIAEDGVCEAVECCKEQEPRAWMAYDDAYMVRRVAWDQQQMDAAGPGLYWEPLYTNPPRRTGLPHCERSCEANAFQIEIRRLKAALKERNA